jgi:hypothetical protein
MLTPLQSSRAPKRRVSDIINFPAPNGGWVSDSFAGSIAPNTARILTNMVPLQNSAQVRNGFKKFAGIPGSVQSLMVYNNGLVEELIVAAQATVYKVPIATDFAATVPVSLATGFGSSYFQHVMMSNAADESALVMVNGVDGIWKYDGATLEEAPASAANKTVSNVTTFKSRLWFTKTAEATLYYGDVLSNKPATLEPLPIGPLLREGGYLVAVNSLSMDGGSGPDDYLVAVSSTGEVVVFSGIDPATDFQLVGVFKMAAPLGPRCLIKNGSDLLYYGLDGPQALSRLFTAPQGVDTIAIAIRSEFEKAIYNQRLDKGWELIAYPRRGWVIFNVPKTDYNKIDQFIMSQETQAWFRITGWNAICFAVLGTNLFFGANSGDICVADYGQNDNGASINFDYMQSWQQYNTANRKKFNMAQVTIRANSPPVIAADMNVDYKDIVPTSTPGFSPKAIESPWDVSPWDTSPWTAGEIYYVNSFGVANIGYVGAFRYRGRLLDTTHEFLGYRIAYEEGEFL